jgi:hypothetical protein
MTVHHLLEAELEILDAVSFYKARAGDLAVNFTPNSSGRGKRSPRFRNFGAVWAEGIAANFWGDSLTGSFTGSKVTKS